METPRKVVDADSQCFLCSSRPPIKERIKIFGKSSVDIEGLLKSIEIDVSRYFNASSLFICSRICYKRLLKLKKLQNELNSVKQTLIEAFPQTRTKRLRSNTDDQDDQYIKIDAFESKVSQSNAVKSLRFQSTCSTTTCTSSTNCYLLDQAPSSIIFGVDDDVLSSQEATFIPPPIFPPMPMLLNLTSTPIRIPRPESSRVNPASCVKLSVHYDSKTVNKTLPKEYELLGKALAHGPPQRIAKAILNCLTLKKLVIEKVLRLVCSEASDLCSRKEPSLLRKTGKSDIVNFSFQSLCEEWKTKAPIFYAFLMTVARSKNATWLPSVAVAGSVLLKQRNTQMNATATTLGIMLKTGSIEVIYFKLCLIFLNNHMKRRSIFNVVMSSHRLVATYKSCHIVSIITERYLIMIYYPSYLYYLG